MPAGCSVQDVVGALLDLIDKSGGRLHGAQVLTSLAKLSPVFRAKVEAAGGPKKFCAAHREVEFITVESSDGFVQRRPTSRQEVIVALLDLISSAGGKLSGAQAVTKLSKLDPAFKGIIDAAGGLRKFCAAQPEVEFITDKGDGHVQRHAQKASEQDVVDALLQSIDRAGGKVNGGQAVTNLGTVNPAFTSMLDVAGGLKKFCAANKGIDFITKIGGHCFIQRQALEASAQDVAKILCELIDKIGGRLNGAQVVTELGKVSPAYKAVVVAAGGPKKFCASHPGLEFITNAGGDGFVERSAPKATLQDVEGALLELIDKAGGRLDGVHIINELSKVNLAFRGTIDAVGGPEKLCERLADLEVVIASGGPWHVRRSAAARLPGKDAKVTDALRVSDIYWSQDCVKVSFRNGTYLIDLLQELLDEPSRMQGLPLLDVAEHDGRWYAISGNRRLWVLKEYARLNDPMLSIPVRIRNLDVNRWAKLFKMRYSTESRGAHVGVVFQHRLKYQHFCTMTLALEAKLCRDIVAAESRQEGDTDSDESSSLESSSTASSRHRSADSGSLGLSALRRRVSVAAKLQARPDQNTSDTMRRTAEVGQLP